MTLSVASKTSSVLLILVAYVSYYWAPHVSWYQVSTSARGVYDLLNLPEEEIEAWET